MGFSIMRIMDLILNTISAAAAAGIGYVIGGGWIGALAGFLLGLPFAMLMASADGRDRRDTQALRREPVE